MARPQRQSAGGTSAGGQRVAVPRDPPSIPAAANDNRRRLTRQALRLLPLVGAIGLLLNLIRYGLS